MNLNHPNNKIQHILTVILVLIQSSLVPYSASAQQKADDAVLKVLDLRLEYHENPLGIDVRHPRFSWRLEGDGYNRSQSAYQIVVASSRENLESGVWDMWDSKMVKDNSTNQIVYMGQPLKSQEQYFWKVQVWDEKNRSSGWSETAYWSIGVLNFSEWKGQFIGLDVGHRQGDIYKELYLPPARYLRKSFSIEKKVKRATAYSTALGLYELSLNGSKVGDYYFLPGWSDYDKRVYYKTFDLTDQLIAGENVLGATIADGWYAGYLGYALLVRLDIVRGFYGENPAFMGQLVIEYEDGTQEIIRSDRSWKANTGPILEADMLMGESYDARLELKGWDEPGFVDSLWQKAKLYTYPKGKLQAYPGSMLKERERLKPKSVSEPKPGTYVFDLGKNFAGIAELKVEGPEGTKIELKYGEILNADGTVLTENLRKARATDYYTLKGEGIEVWQPKFTYHGFQYVEVSGFPGKPTTDAITGIVISSIELDASTFSSSNQMNNTLYQNIKTTQSANFFEVPTDCPQRDERLGWTGDAQIFCRSSTYNADVASFFTKFLIDLDDAQRWYGAYTNFAPFPYSRPYQYSPAWMDAGVIIPYNLYKVYGDIRQLEFMYPGMTKFMDFQADAATDFLRPAASDVAGINYGDWLSVNEKTSDDLIASAFYGFDADLMSRMAGALEKKADEDKYSELFENIRSAFAQKYILDNGYTTEDTQTSYALALYFGLYPDELADKGAARLAEKIMENGNKFSTGFLGTKHVMLVLTRYGYDDLSYILFKQTEYPSWGYSVVNGSTSIWERWNSYTKDPEQNSSINSAMNSFSHYAFGSVAEWMFLHGLGIDTGDAGYRNIVIKPSISKEMDFMRGSYESINGTIRSAWVWKGKSVEYSITIPVNTRAKIYLPTSDPGNIKQGNKSLAKQDGIEIIESTSSETIVGVGSGTYTFLVRI